MATRTNKERGKYARRKGQRVQHQVAKYLQARGLNVKVTARAGYHVTDLAITLSDGTVLHGEVKARGSYQKNGKTVRIPFPSFERYLEADTDVCFYWRTRGSLYIIAAEGVYTKLVKEMKNL